MSSFFLPATCRTAGSLVLFLELPQRHDHKNLSAGDLMQMKITGARRRRGMVSD